MSLSSGRLESEILRLEREVWQFMDLVGSERGIRLTALEQQLAALWMYTGPTASNTATFSGTVHGCNSSLQSGKTVTIKDHASGSTLATATTDASGVFSGSVTLSGATQSVDITLSALSPYAAYSTTQTWTAGTSNAAGTLTLSPDATHVCFPGCDDPISTTLTLVDSIYGTYTLTWDGVNQWATSGATLDYTFSGGAQSCLPASNVPVKYSLSLTTSPPWVAAVTWNVVGSGDTCPGPNTPPAALNWANSGATCSPFQISATFTSSVTLYLDHTCTITITE